MSKQRIVCPHCGAVQVEPSGVCDLCGSELVGDSSEVEDSVPSRDAQVEARLTDDVVEPAEQDAPSVDEDEEPAFEKGGFCTQCGSPYPVGSRFCGSCGARIQKSDRSPSGARPAEPVVPAGPPAMAPPAQKRAATDRELGRQVLLVVGAAIVLIVALFVITVVSGDSDSPPAAAASSAAVAVESAPLPPEVQGTVQALRAEAESLTGEERVAKLRELSDFLLSHGRWDLAGEVQAEIGEQTGLEADWVRSGNLYYDSMESVEGEAKIPYAKKAVESYQRALQINPDNLDVRTDMAIAYMFDPENSVQAIAQTNMVLDADSLHVQANFNRGIMLLRINRFEEAAAQFNKVKRIIGDPSNPVYQRAESALDALRQVGG